MTTINIKYPSRYVHFSMPLARGTYTWAQGTCAVRVFDGDRELPCQNSRQARYPDGSAASVYVYADAGEGNAPSSVEVRFDPHTEREYPPFQFHPRLSDVRVWMEFERDASGRLLPATMDGPVAVQRRVVTEDYAIAFVTFFNGSPIIRVDSLEHNAFAGAPMQERSSSPLVGVHEDWMYRDAIPGQVEPSGPFPQRQGLVRRSLWFPVSELARSNEAHWCYGWGTAADEWTLQAALAPHFVPCADLEHLPGLEAQQTASWSVARQALTNGTEYPPGHGYPYSRRIGLLHPGYSHEGGETSGSQVNFGGPQGAIATGNPDAILLAMAEQYFRLSRDRWLLVDQGNEPARWEGYIDPSGAPAQGWRMSVDDPGKFDKSGGATLDGPWGFSHALPPTVVDQDLQDLLAYECTDEGHRIRETQWTLTLAQLINCPVSRWLIRAEGERARMSWRCGGRRAGDLATARNGLGIKRDRILGWQIHSMATAYAWGPNDLRSRFDIDMGSIDNMAVDATEHATVLCAITTGKQVDRAPYNKLYAVCVQPTGETILWQGVLAARSVHSGYAMALGQKAASAIEWLRKGNQILWSAAVYDLATKTPISPRNDALTSAAWPSGSYDQEQALGVLGLAGLCGADPMATIRGLLGNAPLAAMKAKGLSTVDSDLHLLAFLQKIGSA